MLCCNYLPTLQIISGLDAGITAMFGMEALLKIIAFTFVAYIRVNSNKVGPFSYAALQSGCVYTQSCMHP